MAKALKKPLHKKAKAQLTNTAKPLFTISANMQGGKASNVHLVCWFVTSKREQLLSGTLLNLVFTPHHLIRYPNPLWHPCTRAR
jgi:hypothetical protein